MLEGFFGKVMAGLLSISALTFSPQTGNLPQFRPLQCKAGQNYLLIQAALDKAFDNDFSDVFRCGKPVTVWYKIEIRQAGRTVLTQSYRHTITFDPMNAAWELFTSENGRREILTSYAELLPEIALLSCSIPRDRAWKSVEIRAEAWLQEVELTQPQHSVDLMVLWKYKRPSARAIFTLPPTS
jgi:hypothetical protein